MIIDEGNVGSDLFGLLEGGTSVGGGTGINQTNGDTADLEVKSPLIASMSVIITRCRSKRNEPPGGKRTSSSLLSEAMLADDRVLLKRVVVGKQ